MDDNGVRRNTVPDKRDNMHEIALRHRWRAGVATLSHARPPVSDALRRRGVSGLGCFVASMVLFCEFWDKSREIKNPGALHQFYCDRTIIGAAALVGTEALRPCYLAESRDLRREE